MRAAAVRPHPTGRRHLPTGRRGSSRVGRPRATALPVRRARPAHGARVHRALPAHGAPVRQGRPGHVRRVRPVRPAHGRLARPVRAGRARPGHGRRVRVAHRVRRVRPAAVRPAPPDHAVRGPAVRMPDRRLQRRLPHPWPRRQPRRRVSTRRPVVSVSSACLSVRESFGPPPPTDLTLLNVCIGQLSIGYDRHLWDDRISPYHG